MYFGFPRYRSIPGREAQKRRYAAYELWYTIVDVGAGLSFLCGSLLFMSVSTKDISGYLFLAGSALFLMKPAIRLMHEARYAAHGYTETLAHRAGWTPDRQDRAAERNDVDKRNGIHR